MLNLYTGSLNMLHKLKEDFPDALFVSVARGEACRKACHIYLEYVMPTWNLINALKVDGIPWKEYRRRYREYLSLKDRREVYAYLETHAKSHGTDTVIMLCYELSDQYCHRSILADWLTEAGYYTTELRYKHGRLINRR